MSAKYVLKNKLPLIFVLSSMNERTTTKCPTVKFSLNKKEFVGLLDTGCSHSIIKVDALPDFAKLLPCNIQLNDCSSTLKIFGETVLEVKFGELVFKQKFIVVSSTIRIPVNAIFGMDLFRRFKCKISFETNKLYLQHNLHNYVVDFTYSIQESNESTYFVHAISAVIPPFSQMVLKAYCKSPDGDYLLNKASVGSSTIYVAESLVTVKNCVLYMQVVNLNKSPVKLYDNQILSTINSLSECDSLLSIGNTTGAPCNVVQ